MKTNRNIAHWMVVIGLALACFPLAAVAAIHVKLAVNGGTIALDPSVRNGGK